MHIFESMDGHGQRDQTSRDGAVNSQPAAQRSNDPAAIAAAAVDVAMAQTVTKSSTGHTAESAATPPALVPIDPRRQRPASTPRAEAGGPVRDATSEAARISNGKSTDSSSGRSSEQQRISMPPSKRSKTEDEPLKRLLAQRYDPTSPHGSLRSSATTAYTLLNTVVQHVLARATTICAVRQRVHI